MTWSLLCGIYNVAFGLFHLTFWRLFHWKEQLPRLSTDNRAVVQALNLCLTFFLLLAGALCLFYPAELHTTQIGRAVAIGMLLFWVARAVQQALLFEMSRRVHQLVLAVFVLGVTIHAANLWS